MQSEPSEDPGMNKSQTVLASEVKGQANMLSFILGQRELLTTREWRCSELVSYTAAYSKLFSVWHFVFYSVSPQCYLRLFCSSLW